MDALACVLRMSCADPETPERPSPGALSLSPKAEAGSPEYSRGTSGSHALSFLRLHHHGPSPPCSGAPQAAAWGQGGG